MHVSQPDRPMSPSGKQYHLTHQVLGFVAASEGMATEWTKIVVSSTNPDGLFPWVAFSSQFVATLQSSTLRNLRCMGASWVCEKVVGPKLNLPDRLHATFHIGHTHPPYSSLRALFWCMDIWILIIARACSFWQKFWPPGIARFVRCQKVCSYICLFIASTCNIVASIHNV